VLKLTRANRVRASPGRSLRHDHDTAPDATRLSVVGVIEREPPFACSRARRRTLSAGLISADIRDVVGENKKNPLVASTAGIG